MLHMDTGRNYTSLNRHEVVRMIACNERQLYRLSFRLSDAAMIYEQVLLGGQAKTLWHPLPHFLLSAFLSPCLFQSQKLYAACDLSINNGEQDNHHESR